MSFLVIPGNQKPIIPTFTSTYITCTFSLCVSHTATFLHLQLSIFITSHLVSHTAVILLSHYCHQCVCVCVGDTRFARLTCFLIIQQHEHHFSGKRSALINNGVITLMCHGGEIPFFFLCCTSLSERWSEREGVCQRCGEVEVLRVSPAANVPHF